MESFEIPVNQPEEEVDMFAELGALRPVLNQTQSVSIAQTNNQFDPLAAFMDDEEDEQTLTADSMFSMTSEQDEGFTFIEEPDSENSSLTHTVVEAEVVQEPVMSSEVITELLEVLVKNELQAREQRGENWLSDLPAEAIAQIESARVIKNQEAYHLSLVIDMVGTGQVRPFATVLSTGDGPLPVSPSAQIPSTWQPLYNAIREILMQAMNALSSINVSAAKATV